jgi:hypothetical protein
MEGFPQGNSQIDYVRNNRSRDISTPTWAHEYVWYRTDAAEGLAQNFQNGWEMPYLTLARNPTGPSLAGRRAPLPRVRCRIAARCSNVKVVRCSMNSSPPIRPN